MDKEIEELKNLILRLKEIIDIKNTSINDYERLNIIMEDRIKYYERHKIL
jgi:hypothetical protein